MLILILMSNMNLFLFYGMDGQEPKFNRVIGGVDIALLFSFIDVIFFLFFWATTIVRSNSAKQMISEDKLLGSEPNTDYSSKS